MKFTNPLPQFKKCIIFFSVGISCSILACLLRTINPMKLILNQELQMTPNSLIFELWRKPIVDVYIKIYIFNITNAEEFLEGGVKLKVEEVGPYVYQEILENTNVTWHENSTISYVPKRKIVYVPELSIGNPEVDTVFAPNIPMLMYDEGNNVVLMNIGHNENMTEEEGRYLSIQLYNGSPGMSQWGYREDNGNETYPEKTICNLIRGSTEGELFPAYLDKHAAFRIFRKAFCRTIPIVFKEEVVAENGLDGYLYSMSDNFLDTPDENPDNTCYCKKKGKCLKKGLADITPCYYSIPAAMSLPHFLHADPSLQENIEGINPDPEKHTTKIILEPTIGFPMKVNSKIQINLVMHPVQYNSQIKLFNNLVIPLFWSDLVIPQVPSDLLFLVKLLLQVGPIMQEVLIWLLAIAGVTMFVLLITTLWTTKQQQQSLPVDRRDSYDLRVPLHYGQYTTIKILSAIKN
ncbi:scavenger receptor class B member 1-like isoform X2 [Bombus pyrosoma]|uniref:scavenger receptor class B member 1-like isoform X2 n=1 Tax=Bombus pyrosoma TaxID=396416 RepID=UPI001CB916E0|nr:scavenger receptor class B member 1-like isoform X2 [Bombus pyrosoma]